jgi:L-ascorbate oxidase
MVKASRIFTWALLALASGPAVAQNRSATNPPELQVLRGPEMPTAAMREEAGPIPAVPVKRLGNEATAALDVTQAVNRIWNPFTNSFDVVFLRSFNGTLMQLPKDEQGWREAPLLVGPTIRLNPSETVRITLNNKLPDIPCVAPQGTHSIPSCFNFTNLHSHGLHVSPSGNGDNVLLEIKPGESFEYEYNLAADHPAGTFWYHPHRHGSTALQVSSGMAGALIVNGNRKPELSGSGQTLPGDIDTLLMTPGAYPAPTFFPERVLLFEQIQYQCRGRNGRPLHAENPWSCEPTEEVPLPIGTIEKYDQFGPGTWKASGRFTLVNGLLQPTLSLSPSTTALTVNATVGQIERWRMIHAGVRDTIKLAIYKATQPVPTDANFATAEQRQRFTTDNCNGRLVTQWMIAEDGLTRDQIIPISAVDVAGQPVTIPNVLQPGYRSDVLVIFPEEGDYCLIDEEAPASDTVAETPKDRRLLATVRAEGTGGVSADKAGLTQALVTAANAAMPPTVRQRVIDDLNADLKLTLFAPHPTITDAEVTGKQTLAFNIDTTDVSNINPHSRFGINHRSYDPNRIDRELKLGTADEWFLTSPLLSHPFHIHINPFQVVRILKQVQIKDSQGNTVTEWKDLTDPAIDYVTRLGWETQPGSPPDPEYLNLRGVWKDTLFVKQGYRVFVRSRYERYIGDFVLHCHILDHQDQGMMENVRISLSVDETQHGNH